MFSGCFMLMIRKMVSKLSVARKLGWKTNIRHKVFEYSWKERKYLLADEHRLHLESARKLNEKDLLEARFLKEIIFFKT